jgi:hypothetical protein
MLSERASPIPPSDGSLRPGDDGLITLALGKAFLFVSLLLILFFGYFPFDFSFPGDWAQTIRGKFDLGMRQYYLANDIRDNLLFFVPLGFALALLTPAHLSGPPRVGTRGRWLARVLASLIVGGCVSAMVEIGQCFLGARDPSLVDLVNNALGTALAFAGLGLLAPLVLPPIVGLLRAGSRFIGWKALTSASVLWVLLAIIPLHYARDFGDLVRWDPRYSLTVGNSVLLNRPWRGTVRQILLADRAVADSEAEVLLEGPFETGLDTVFGKDRGHVRTWFDFTRGWPIVDRSGHVPPFIWYSSAHKPNERFGLMAPPMAPSTPASNEGVDIDGTAAWLSTAAPAASMIEAIKASSRFALLASLATADSLQRGPGRILTISDERPRGNNLTIGQEGSDLVIRLRARVTARAGVAPQITVPDVFADTRPRVVLVSYQPWRLSTYVDDVKSKSELVFTPEAALMWQLYPRPDWTFRMGSVGTGFYRPVYRCLFFAPLGVLLAMSAKLGGLTRRAHWLVIAIAAVIACGLLESIGARAGIVGFRVSGAIVCLGSTLLGASLVRTSRGRDDPDLDARPAKRGVIL